MKIRRFTSRNYEEEMPKIAQKVMEKSWLESERNYINRKWILGLMMTLAVSFEVDDVCVNGKFKAIDFVCQLIF